MDTNNIKNNPNNRNIALTFSGGGFRAAGFALGTMTLLQKIGLMKKVQAISSASGGSIATAFFLVAKASILQKHNEAESEQNFNEQDFDFATFKANFYQPLKLFLESNKVPDAILLDLGGNHKEIKKAANCYQQELENLAKKITKKSGSVLISELIWQLLNSDNLAPDCLSINATNMTDASLFRFAILRTKDNNQDNNQSLEGVILGNKFINLNNEENSLSNCIKNLKIGDMIAASSCFPFGFEPIIFPDDFSTSETEQNLLTKFLDNQDKIALLDAGIYDNLALTSIESLRVVSDTINQPEKGITLPESLNLVIVTDADNLEPSEALMNPNSGSDLIDFANNLNWFPRILITIIIKLFNSSLIKKLTICVGIKQTNLLTSLSWLSINLQKSTNFIQNRKGELSPLFGGFLKRNRNLTYQFLNYKYQQENQHSQDDQKITLLRNLIFDLYNSNDQDTLLSELVPKLTHVDLSKSDQQPQNQNYQMIAKINKFVFDYQLSKYETKEEIVKTFKQRPETNITNIMCLAKLATSLPTTLWLKWYNICTITNSKTDSKTPLREFLLDSESICEWKIKNKKNYDLCHISFAEKIDQPESTAAEVVIACGFVATCYNILECCANSLGILNQKPETLENSWANCDHNCEQLKQKLGLEKTEVNHLLDLWWEIITILEPLGNFSDPKVEAKILHNFIKKVIVIATS